MSARDDDGSVEGYDLHGTADGMDDLDCMLCLDQGEQSPWATVRACMWRGWARVWSECVECVLRVCVHGNVHVARSFMWEHMCEFTCFVYICMYTLMVSFI